MEKTKVTDLQHYEKLLEEYEESLQIDKNNLDVHLVEQATIYYRVSEAYAMALSFRDFAKSNIDIVRASLDRETREKALESNHRLTEAQVNNLILEHTSYQLAMINYLEWKTASDRWLALKDSYNQRAYALRDLVNLYSMGYYSDSIAKTERNDARDRVAATVRETLAEERRKRHG